MCWDVRLGPAVAAALDGKSLARAGIILRVLDLFPRNKIYGPGPHFEARSPSLTGKAWRGVFLEHA